MRSPWLILLYILFPFLTLAQNGTITGVVTNSETKNPLARASVFLSNSANGTATNDNGKYLLSNIRPGQYTLVVSILGYEQYEKSILIGREPIQLNIALAPKPLMLRAVVISSNADWKKNYEEFKKAFIGVDENAKLCTVINPHVLNISYNPTKRTLHADAEEFLIVENRALGYRVKYLLNDFNIDNIDHIVSRSGQQVFEDLPGSAAQKKKWHEKREEAYYGSAMHFYRSLYAEKLKQEGFQIYHLVRYPNPLRPDDEIIKRRFDRFNNLHMIDSAKYYQELSKISKWYHESVISPAYMEFEILSRGDQKGTFNVHFPNFLYVVYTKRTDDTYDRDLYRPLDMPNYEVSVVTMLKPATSYDIDMNGIVINGGPLYEGAWARSRISDLLPVDYVPDNK